MNIRILAILFVFSVNTSASNPPKTLAEISANLNKSLPEIFDLVTKLVSTSVENNNFKYHFIIKANHKEYSWALPKVKSSILETICSRPREKLLLKQHRANIVYSYENVEGHFLGQFMVKPEHCL